MHVYVLVGKTQLRIYNRSFSFKIRALALAPTPLRPITVPHLRRSGTVCPEADGPGDLPGEALREDDAADGAERGGPAPEADSFLQGNAELRRMLNSGLRGKA
jgi:hypothetical protein